MPTYEYRCGQCGHEFEEFSLKISNESTRRCPKCGGSAERLISGGAGLLFKGSGFYATDYRSKSYEEAARKEKEPKTGADSGAGSDASPEGKKKKDEK